MMSRNVCSWDEKKTRGKQQRKQSAEQSTCRHRHRHRYEIFPRKRQISTTHVARHVTGKQPSRARIVDINAYTYTVSMEDYQACALHVRLRWGHVARVIATALGCDGKYSGEYIVYARGIRDSGSSNTTPEERTNEHHRTVPP